MKLSEKNWFIILMLIIFFPIGLYLMWKNAKWNKIIKIIITIFIGICIFIPSGDKNNNNNATNNIKTEVKHNKYEELENNCKEILNSKDYYSMTDEERNQINDLINKMDKIDEDFKTENKDLLDKYKTDKYYDNNYKGVIIADIQEVVKKQLKSPNSAKFPLTFDEYDIKYVGETDNGMYTYTVTSYVDAKNSFNAELRVKYTGAINVTKDLEKYQALVYLEE